MIPYILDEFRKFALRGNILDLAIGIIIGGSFNKLVSSLVQDMLMPFIGLLLGKVDFSSLAFTIGQSTIKYGSFIQSIVDFLIVACSVFVLIKAINLIDENKIDLDAIPVDKQQLEILKDIRDTLAQDKMTKI